MLDWLASVAVVRRTEHRIELAVTTTTTWAGWAVVAVALLGSVLIWPWSRPIAAVPILIAALGALVATARRRLVFDRDDGLFRVEQQVLGMRSRLAIPLFHLRSIVIANERGHFVAYVERRTGGRIRIDDSRQLAKLLAVAHAICEVAQLRLITDAPDHSSTVG
jgi:hypothetical protein